jgi:hypothetical protein
VFACPRFRWVQCSIDALDRCTTWKEVRNALDSLPTGLDETYERILLAIDTGTSAGKLTQKALVWLVAALRPLRLPEIMEALSINLETRTLDSDIGPMHNGALLDACGSLVTYTERTGIIILSHSSVKVNAANGCSRITDPCCVGVPHGRVHAHQTTAVPHQLGMCTLAGSPVMHVLYFYVPQAWPGICASRCLQLYRRLLQPYGPAPPHVTATSRLCAR